MAGVCQRLEHSRREGTVLAQRPPGVASTLSPSPESLPPFPRPPCHLQSKAMSTQGMQTDENTTPNSGTLPNDLGRGRTVPPPRPSPSHTSRHMPRSPTRNHRGGSPLSEALFTLKLNATLPFGEGNIRLAKTLTPMNVSSSRNMQQNTIPTLSPLSTPQEVC
jgi:hypothetical protein